MRKYNFTGKTKTLQDGTIVNQIRYTDDFIETCGSGYEKLGGWIESESNLSHNGQCYIERNSIITGDAVVCEDVDIRGRVLIKDRAWVGGTGTVKNSYNHRKWLVICDDTKISGWVWWDIYGTISGNSFLTEIDTDELYTLNANFHNVRLLGNCWSTWGGHGDFEDLFKSVRYPKTMVFQLKNEIVFRFGCKRKAYIDRGLSSFTCEYFELSTQLDQRYCRGEWSNKLKKEDALLRKVIIDDEEADSV